jgi:hypothetical protein
VRDQDVQDREVRGNMAKTNRMEGWRQVGSIVFFIGIVLFALSITAVPSKELLLVGMIIAGGGFAVELAIGEAF